MVGDPSLGIWLPQISPNSLWTSKRAKIFRKSSSTLFGRKPGGFRSSDEFGSPNSFFSSDPMPMRPGVSTSLCSFVFSKGKGPAGFAFARQRAPIALSLSLSVSVSKTLSCRRKARWIGPCGLDLSNASSFRVHHGRSFLKVLDQILLVDIKDSQDEMSGNRPFSLYFFT